MLLVLHHVCRRPRASGFLAFPARLSLVARTVARTCCQRLLVFQACQRLSSVARISCLSSAARTSGQTLRPSRACARSPSGQPVQVQAVFDRVQKEPAACTCLLRCQGSGPRTCGGRRVFNHASSQILGVRESVKCKHTDANTQSIQTHRCKGKHTASGSARGHQRGWFHPCV